MKYKILFILLLVVLYSCNSAKDHIRLKNTTWDRRYTKQDFKDYVFCECLLAGLGDESIREKFEMTDKTFYSPVHAVLFDSISKVIVKPVILSMKVDSAESVGRVSEATEHKKNVFGNCMNFYKSKELDSIARVSIKRWARIKDFESFIGTKIAY